jgi:hypothetical protein
MMSELLNLFVHEPMRILALAALYLAIWGALRLSRLGRRADPLLLPCAFCLAFAGWEWLVLIRTPEANIRVDLLLIWPALLLMSVWALIRIVRGRAPRRPAAKH